MDILYVIGNGSKWSNNELRYSLRSLCKFGKNVGRIFVCGVNPGVISDEVTFIPCDDPYDAPHKNIMHKIGYAMSHSDIGSHFLLSSDDHFFVRDVDFDKYPYYCKGVMPNVAADKSPYQLSLAETHALLLRHELPTFLMNPHCNTHITADAWKKTEKIRNESLMLSSGGEINCILGNWYIKSGIIPTAFIDCKIKSSNALALLKDCHCISIYDEAINNGMVEYLRKLFPEPCKYEVGDVNYSNSPASYIKGAYRYTNYGGISIIQRN